MAMEGSRWFRRLVRECKRISPHIRIKRIKHGFYRIYYQRAYIHEVYKEMPLNGHDVEENNIHMTEHKYMQEYEDQFEITRKVKNYVEGYFDSLDRVKTRVWMMENNKEFNQTATKRYETVVIK